MRSNVMNECRGPRQKRRGAHFKPEVIMGEAAISLLLSPEFHFPGQGWLLGTPAQVPLFLVLEAHSTHSLHLWGQPSTTNWWEVVGITLRVPYGIYCCSAGVTSVAHKVNWLENIQWFHSYSASLPHLFSLKRLTFPQIIFPRGNPFKDSEERLLNINNTPDIPL